MDVYIVEYRYPCDTVVAGVFDSKEELAKHFGAIMREGGADIDDESGHKLIMDGKDSGKQHVGLVSDIVYGKRPMNTVFGSIWKVGKNRGPK